MSPATFIVIMATIVFFACVATAMTAWCFALMGQRFTLRRELRKAQREIARQGKELAAAEGLLRAVLGLEPWQDPNATLTVADIVGEEL